MAGAKLDGTEGVFDLLNRLSGDTMISTVETGIKRTMQRMVQDARKKCPKDTEELAKSIFSRVERGSEKNIRAELVAPTEYAIFVEMGTGPKGEAGVSSADVSPEIRKTVTYNATGWFTRSKKDGTPTMSQGMAPSPYLYPAYKENAPKLLKDVKAAAIRVIKGGGV